MNKKSYGKLSFEQILKCTEIHDLGVLNSIKQKEKKGHTLEKKPHIVTNIKFEAVKWEALSLQLTRDASLNDSVGNSYHDGKCVEAEGLGRAGKINC